MSSSRSSTLGLMAAAPAVIGTLAVLAFAAREVSGTTPLSYGPVRNVAEAAGAGQVSEVLRFLRAGEDPAQFWPVRPEIISSTVTRPTGLEAALWGGRQLVELLDRRGLVRDAATRAHLFCLAKDIGSEEVASYLSPADAPPCDPGAAFAAIKDRSERATRAPATP
jgi:hypothetical protein